MKYQALHKENRFFQWLLIGISILFLFLKLCLPLAVVFTQAFKKGTYVFFKAVTDKNTLSASQLTLTAMVFAVGFNTIFGLFALGQSQNSNLEIRIF